MNRIDELIADLCPAGVEYRILGDVAEVRSGWGFPHADQGAAAGDFPFYKVSDMNLPGNELVMHAANNYVNHAVAQRLRVSPAPAGTVIFPKIGAAVATNKKRLLSVSSAFDNNVMGLIPGDDLCPRFLLYWMQTVDLAEISNDSGAVPSIRKSEMHKVRIPVPPLEVQEEIVRILDQFTKLEAELDAELTARRIQRVTFSRTLPGAANLENSSSRFAERIRLGEVASQYVEPIRVQADTTYTSLGVKWYGEGVLTREPRPGSQIKAPTLYGVKPGHLIYNRMFVAEGSFAIVPPELANGVVSNEFPVYELDNSRVLPEWLLLYFRDEYTLKRIAAETTGVERGSMKSRRRWKEAQFEAFTIALPPISVQSEMIRVVGTVRALESALYDELTARRKQYEYYRDRLLTFEEAAA